MRVSIIAIGDELLIGQVVDTNSGDIARMLAPQGWEVDNIQVVADDSSAIRTAIEHAMMKTDIVLTTGGLGPTKDDITKSVLCDYFGGRLIKSESVLKNVRLIMEKRGLSLNNLTESQAMVPDSCKIIQNTLGTAPIMWFEKNGKVLVSMPGVPFETLGMFSAKVMPMLLEKFPNDMHVAHSTIIVSDISESDLAERLADYEASLPGFIHLAYLPKPGLIRLRLDGHNKDKKLLEQSMSEYRKKLIELTSDRMLFDDDKPVPEILLYYLEKNKLTIATAESCTGGTIASRITSVPGSSSAMKGGVVAYSNEVKMALLGVRKETLDKVGAVSEKVVEQMATGVAKATGADMTISTSGIAGPAGGSTEKPVGTVCIGLCAFGRITKTLTKHFPGDRSRVTDRSSTTAMIEAIKWIRSGKYKDSQTPFS